MLTPPPTPHDAVPLRDRVILVTGGAQGIGRGIVQAVLGAGGFVMFGDLDVDAGRACLDEFAAIDPALAYRATFRRLDVRREASVRAFVQAALDRFDRIDGLVNNAGIADPHNGPLEDLSLADWNRRLGTSLGGAFLCCKHALHALRTASTPQRASAIVNIGSTRARQSEPDSEAYAAAKGGLEAFTHALAISAGPAVRVNAIHPGWIATDAWRKPTARRKPALRRVDHVQHPVGRVGDPRDIGALAVYLLSSAAGFVTGQAIEVDGGMTRKMQYV